MGNGDHTAIVEVINVECFIEDKSPFPIDKIKKIIRKYTDDEQCSSEGNNEINFPGNRKDEVKKWFAKYDIIEHNCYEDDYEYLAENECVLEIVSPNNFENLFIELSDEFIMTFGDWHTHYIPYENGYQYMKNDIFSLVNGECGLLSIYIDGKIYSSSLLYKKSTSLFKLEDIINMIESDGTQIPLIEGRSIVIEIIYWDGSKYKFVI